MELGRLDGEVAFGDGLDIGSARRSPSASQRKARMSSSPAGTSYGVAKSLPHAAAEACSFPPN